MVIWIKFGRWSMYASSYFVYYRLYPRNWTWSPFVRVERRYKKKDE